MVKNKNDYIGMLDYSFWRPSVPRIRNEKSRVELSFPGPFVPWNGIALPQFYAGTKILHPKCRKNEIPFFESLIHLLSDTVFNFDHRTHVSGFIIGLLILFVGYINCRSIVFTI